MKKFSVLFLGVLLFMLVGCSSVTTNYDYDPGVDFSKFKTFTIRDSKVPGNVLERNQLLQKRVDEAIKNALEAKGYKYVDSPDEASMVVVAHGRTKEKVQVTDWGSYGWYRPWWGPYGGQVDVSNYTEGTLVIDIVDMSDKELAWRGLATGIVGNPESNPEKQQAKVESIVTKILNDFPPPKSK
jgi:hypothetical protein